MLPVGGRFLAAGLLAAVLAITAAAGGEPKDYAYLFMQGKLSHSGEGRPVVGAAVTLSRGEESYRAVTDARGVFTFAKLPPATYEMEVRTAEGRVIRDVRRFDTATQDLTMLDVRVGGGGRAAGPIVIEADESPVAVQIPEPHTRWGRLWKELLVFAGIALLLLAL